MSGVAAVGSARLPYLLGQENVPKETQRHQRSSKEAEVTPLGAHEWTQTISATVRGTSMMISTSRIANNRLHKTNLKKRMKESYGYG
jgi:hypothetical protein